MESSLEIPACGRQVYPQESMKYFFRDLSFNLSSMFLAGREGKLSSGFGIGNAKMLIG